ncbi:hypothetical protein P4S72_26745 [Vibrio sp. PP-XX7]
MAQGVWIPTFELINIIGKSIVANKRLVIAEDGTHIYNERFQGTFSNRDGFSVAFPLIYKILTIIDGNLFTRKKINRNLAKLSVFMEAPDNASLSEWKTQRASRATATKPKLTSILTGKTQCVLPVTVNVAAKRKPNYYLWQFILPLSLILIASWSVFWLDHFHERLMTSFTMMLTVVAYTFYTE